MAFKYWVSVVLALAAVQLVSGARILAFLPLPGKSHQAVSAPIIRELAHRGHQVTAYVPFRLEKPPPNYKEVLVTVKGDDIFESIDIVEMSKLSAVEQIFNLFMFGLFVQEKLCKLDPIQELVHSDQEFDAVIMESLFAQESFSALQHKFGAVAIEISTAGNLLWAYQATGAPYNPSYMPECWIQYFDSMSFVERLHNALAVYGTIAAGYLYYVPRIQTLMDSCFDYKGSETRPPLVELMANKSLVIENSHFSLNYAAPLATHYIDVGGVNIQPSDPLPKDIQTFMDGAIDGVIYFSLGSYIQVSKVTEGNTLGALLAAFGKLKQRVLWKWEKGEMPGRPANVKTSKWFPQQAVLAHKNCKLFITHGGYLSLTETVHNGVPLIGIPFVADQRKNVNLATSLGLGVKIDFGNITEASMTWAINEVLNNPSYREVAKRRSEMFRDRPMSPVDTAVYWVEYAIRHRGAAHLKSALARMTWYKAMLLDVAAFLVVAALVALLLVYFTVLKLTRAIRDFRRRTKAVTMKQKKAE